MCGDCLSGRIDLKLIGTMFLLLAALESYGDLFHYRNVIVGDRAIGLAGAYCAIADDASGVAYNPAGLAFALSNDISGSTNAYYQKSIRYKKTIGDASFTEKSKGTFAPFFGGLQKLDHIANGLASAFGLYSRDADLKDQDDIIQTSTLNLQRTANSRASTNFIGFGAGYRITPSFAIGFSLNVVMVDELTQEFQDVVQVVPEAPTDVMVLSQNIRERLQINALEPVLGFQLALGTSFSLGLAVRKGFFIDQSYETSQQVTLMQVNASTLAPAAGKSMARSRVKLDSDESTSVDDPLGEWPGEARFGIAWFASTRLVMALDVMHTTAAEGELSKYDREAVTDFATGVEFYLTPSVPLRFGIFTNNDARPEAKITTQGGSEQVNYVGGSVVLGWVQPNSQVSLGYVRQNGKGKAQKTTSPTLQDIEAVIHTGSLSATHNF